MPYFKQGKHYTEVTLKVLLGLKGQRKSEGDISGPCALLVLAKQRDTRSVRPKCEETASAAVAGSLS